MRIALTVAYDGRPFDGWQTQLSRNTVQDHLEVALERIVGHRVATVCAGRTDAGVHGVGQVVHFDCDVQRPLSAWVRGVNSHLPDAVAVLAAVQVRADFHARFDASERQYLYLLHVGPVRHPLAVGRAGWTHRPVDAAVMHRAAQALVGTHDFSAFRSAQCQAASPVRTMNRIDVSASGSMVRMHFSANAFLQHMIRNIVGTLLYIGDGRQPPAWAGKLLQARDRAQAAPTFAAGGLYFLGARYADGDGLGGPADPAAIGALSIA